MKKKPENWKCMNCGTVNNMADGSCSKCLSSYKLTMDKNDYDPDSRENYNADHMNSLKIKALGAAVTLLIAGTVVLIYHLVTK